jgi:hypothetical protein
MLPIIGEVAMGGKKMSMVHLPKAKALVMGDCLFHYDAACDQEVFAGPHADPLRPKRFMLMKMTQGRESKWRLIARSGIIPPTKSGSTKASQKYYVDLPFLTQNEEDIQKRKIHKVQRLFRNALSRRRRSLLIAACMAYHPRLGMRAVLGKEDGTASLMHRLIAPFVLKDSA